ncbi:MAG: hypothetical protein ACK40M_10510, partial [Flavobacteriales bacterium]
DNGIGRAESRRIKEKQSELHVSFSSAATDKRMELLKEYTNKNYSIQIFDVPAGGTLVRITFPPY